MVLVLSYWKSAEETTSATPAESRDELTGCLWEADIKHKDTD